MAINKPPTANGGPVNDPNGVNTPSTNPAADQHKDQTPKEKQDEVARKAQQSGDPQYFEGTILKIDKDGNEVMSDHLMPGEKLKSEVTEAYSKVQHSERKDAVNEHQRQLFAERGQGEQTQADKDAAQQKASEEK